MDVLGDKHFDDRYCAQTPYHFVCETPDTDWIRNRYYREIRCPKGWTNYDCGGYCYMSDFTSAASYDEQLKFCREQQGQIAMPKTPREFRSALLAVQHASVLVHDLQTDWPEAWLGVRRTDSPTEFQYEDGEEETYWHFAAAFHVGHCMYTQSNGYIAGAPCSQWKYAVCQRPQTPTPHLRPLECGKTWSLKSKRDVAVNVDEPQYRPLSNRVLKREKRHRVFKNNRGRREKSAPESIPPLNLGNIVRGHAMDIVDVPWAVRILLNYGYHESISNLQCGGVLISPRHVLTAAHCFQAADGVYDTKNHIVVGVGSESEDELSGRKEPLHMLTMHQLHNFTNLMCFYDKNTQYSCRYDFAVLELKRSLPVDCWNIRVVALPTADGKGDLLYKNFDRCITVGWGWHLGVIDTLQACIGNVSAVNFTNKWELVALFHDCGIRPGDSGSPLLCIDDDALDPKWTVVGVTQSERVIGSEIEGHYGNVKTFLKWIKDITQEGIPEVDRVYSETVCTGADVRIECDYGRPPAIRVKHAVYGRKSEHLCLDKGRTWDAMHFDCNVDVTDRVAKWCSGKQACRVKVTAAGLGNPCTEAGKYLQLSYQCVHAEHFQAVVCNYGEVLNISCGMENGLTISIVSAMFGRYSTSTCPTTGSPRTDCYKDIKAVVVQRCEGKVKCRMSRTYKTADDPCPGTDKYYDVIYRCNPARTFSVVLCNDGEHLDISCTKFEHATIQVVSGAFGRKSESICPTKSNHNLDCYTNITDAIATRCNGKVSCNTALSYTQFTDPCPGFNKYYEVVYRCFSDFTSSTDRKITTGQQTKPDTKTKLDPVGTFCPPGFSHHGTECYKLYSDVEKPLFGASTVCRGITFGHFDYKAFLAEPRNKEQDDAIEQMMYHDRVHEVWLGGTDGVKEGVWAWLSDGDVIKYNGWTPGLPDTHRGVNCMAKDHDGWEDVHCDEELPFICQVHSRGRIIPGIHTQHAKAGQEQLRPPVILLTTVAVLLITSA